MSQSADVRSIEAIRDFRQAFATFALEADRALVTVDLEIRRGLDWIEHDRPEFWSREIRRWTERVKQFKDELDRCLTFQGGGDRRPSCIEERKRLERAQKKLREAEEKVEVVRHWMRVIRHEIEEYIGRVVLLKQVLEGDMPRGLALLDRMLTALEAYMQIAVEAAPPSAEPGSVARTGSDAPPPTSSQDNEQVRP